MKKNKLIGLLLVGLMVAASVLSGCGKNPSKQASNDSEQYLNTVMFEQKTLDINDAEDVNSITILTAVMEGLGRVENTGSGDVIKPGMAESWKISDDGLVYTFKLRDAKWSDGKPVTAQQFVDSWKRLLEPEKGFGYCYFAYDVKNAQKYNAGEVKAEEVGVKALDDKTLEVTLERPTPYFIKKIGFMSLFPIRIEEVQAQGETYGTDFTKMSYCGPYKIVEYVSNNKIVLEKNDTYWDAEKVKMKKITMQEVTEISTQMQMFESKQLDITGATGEYLKTYRDKAKAGDFALYSSTIPSTTYLTSNLKTGGPSGLMNSEKIRQAMSYIIDREDATKNVYGRYVPAYGFVPYKISIGDKEYRKEVAEPMKAEADKYKSVDKVNELFKEGLTELGKDPNGEYKLILLTSGSDAVSKSRQEYWQNTFQKLNKVKVELLVAADTNQFWDIKDEKERYDIVLSGWGGDFDDPMTFLDLWVTGGGNNYATYSSSTYDKLMQEDILKETDISKREEIYAEAEKLLLKEMPIAPIYYQDANIFSHNYVKSIQYPLFGATYEMKYVYTQGR